MPIQVLLRKVPQYARLLRKLCRYKRACNPSKRVPLRPHVLARIERGLPFKCDDPGAYTIDCQIGNHRFDKALLDLGAAINVMPKTIFASLRLKHISSTNEVLQLADSSIRKSYGFVEDILVKVQRLVFPADFYILDMSKDTKCKEPLILGRPFLRTANAIINLKDGFITMEVGSQVIKLNVFEAMKHPNEDYSPLGVHCIDSLMHVMVDENLDSMRMNMNDDIEASMSYLDPCPIVKYDACLLGTRSESSYIVSRCHHMIITCVSRLSLMIFVYAFLLFLSTTPWKREVCSILLIGIGWRECLLLYWRMDCLWRRTCFATPHMFSWIGKAE